MYRNNDCKTIHKTFYKLISEAKEETIAYCYKNPDYLDGTTIGFGFNTADGGGWMPAWDVTEKTEIIEVEIVELK